MKYFFRLTILSVVAYLMMSCCAPCRAYQKSQRPLVGTQWQLVQLGGEMIESPEGSFQVTFSEDGRMVGRGSCNRLMAQFTTDTKHALKIKNIASTRRMCPDMKHEQQFMDALQSATHYDMDGPMMMILSDGELRAVLQSLPAKE